MCHALLDAACLCRAELVVLGSGLVDAVVEEGGEGEAARLLERGVAAVEPREDLAEVRQVVVVAHLLAAGRGTDGGETSWGDIGESSQGELAGRARPRAMGAWWVGTPGRSAGRAACATTCAAAPAARARPRTRRSSAP